MDDNIDPADQSQAFLQRAQSQSTSISPSPALESGRQKTFLFFLKTSHTLIVPNTADAAGNGTVYICPAFEHIICS